MPRCTRCNPNCQACHRKPTLMMPRECPNCGRYNPAEWQVCKKCGGPLPPPEPPSANRGTTSLCFKCTPFKKPLCGNCLKEGRIKKCPACGGYNLSHRSDCKHCGYVYVTEEEKLI